MIPGAEQHTEWIAEFLEYMRVTGFTRFKVSEHAALERIYMRFPI